MPVIENEKLTGIFISDGRVLVALDGEKIAEYDSVKDLIVDLSELRNEFSDNYEVC